VTRGRPAPADRSGDPREAMVGGVAHSGRVILGIAVLLDALLVRLVIVPVALRLLGRWAWWLPRWAGRMLPAVRFGHS
jgi:RND superfamily putative drug exporter